MPFMEWSDQYSVGIDSIDSQHRHFFALINTLHEAFLRGEGEYELHQTIEELADYAALHFQSEENLLREIKFPLTLNHEDEHARFTGKIQGFRDKLSSGNFAITVPLMDLMKQWLSGHILGSDKKYAAFIVENQIHINASGG